MKETFGPLMDTPFTPYFFVHLSPDHVVRRLTARSMKEQDQAAVSPVGDAEGYRVTMNDIDRSAMPLSSPESSRSRD
jgi:hypothetical protein